MSFVHVIIEGMFTESGPVVFQPTYYSTELPLRALISVFGYKRANEIRGTQNTITLIKRQ